jgi:hypothetical protein
MLVRGILLWLLLASALLGPGCANIVPPGGGAKDTLAPKLLYIDPADSGRNVRPQKIELRFDEYVVLQDASTQIQISPLLEVNPTATSDLRRVRVTIPDTLLQENTTYRISFGSAIRDLHEGNPFPAYTYTFSTGSYFDSLRIEGRVVDAATGRPDTGALVVLHPASRGDSAILSKKPQYVTHVDGQGRFQFRGLPSRSFRAYALGDKNGNLIFDGAGERVGFLDKDVMPVVDSPVALLFRSFAERDTAKADSATNAEAATAGSKATAKPAGFTYLVEADTTDKRKRSVELSSPLHLRFTKDVGAIAPGRIFLTTDSLGTSVEVPVVAAIDSLDQSLLNLAVRWRPDALYTLRLQKGFAKDTAGGDALPSRWTFRTKREEDYAILRVNLPTRFYGSGYVLQVVRDGKDTVWQQPVRDTLVSLTRLQPGSFTLRVIEDRNRNGKWDPGVLGARLQPEQVYPYDRDVMLKAGWENLVDFEERKRVAP